MALILSDHAPFDDVMIQLTSSSVKETTVDLLSEALPGPCFTLNDSTPLSDDNILASVLINTETISNDLFLMHIL